jgi:hypothetical protein
LHPQLSFLDSRLATVPLLALVLFFLLKRHSQNWIRSSALLCRLIRPFITFLTIEEAETRIYPNINASNNTNHSSITRKRSWRTVALGVLALFEALGWCSVAIYTYTISSIDPYSMDANYWWNSVIMSVAWAYCAYRPLLRPKLTPMYDCLTIYIVAGILATLHLSRYIYISYVINVALSRDSLLAIGTFANPLFIGILLGITLTTHIANPGLGTSLSRVQDDDIIASDVKRISPEDYTTLWNWITFAWLTPVTQQPNLAKEKDIWSLSPVMSTEAVYAKFKETGREVYIDIDIKGKGKGEAKIQITPSQFVWHWWRANSLDILGGFLFCTVASILEFAGPLCLKLILDSLSAIMMPALNHSLTQLEIRQLRAQAVVYSLLYFVASTTRSFLLLHHLWFGRRAGMRTRNEVMIWIYEKALRRREVSAPPTMTKEQAKTKEGEHSATATATNEGEQKQKAADLGKVVNLMSTDVVGLEMLILLGPYIFVRVTYYVANGKGVRLVILTSNANVRPPPPCSCSECAYSSGHFTRILIQVC